MKPIQRQFFKSDTIKVAEKLIGKIISYNGMSGRIVETEAYKGYPDQASHAAKRTPRSAIMFDTYGHFYVYFVYGNHHCMNITTEDGRPGAVLIRAIEPLGGIPKMRRNRKLKDEALHNLTNGPGKLCEAFGITRKFNGTAVGGRIKVLRGAGLKKNEKTASSGRIGIKKARELKWRFYLKGNPCVSRA